MKLKPIDITRVAVLALLLLVAMAGCGKDKIDPSLVERTRFTRRPVKTKPPVAPTPGETERGRL